MSRKAHPDAAKRRENQVRIGINCTRQQKQILEEAALARTTDLGTMVLTYALAGIGALGAADRGEGQAGNLPVFINGSVGATLRARAAAQGVPPDRMLELLLGAVG